MNNHIDLQEYRHKRTEEELEKFEQRLHERRDHLYLSFKNLNKEKKECDQRITECDKRMRYLERHENYFQNQERRLLLMAVIAFTLLLLWFVYLLFNGAELGEMIWITSASVLGVLLVTILIIYFLDKNGLKEHSERMILRALFHLAMSPLYLLRLLWSAVKKMFKRLFKKPRINK